MKKNKSAQNTPYFIFVGNTRISFSRIAKLYFWGKSVKYDWFSIFEPTTSQDLPSVIILCLDSYSSTNQQYAKTWIELAKKSKLVEVPVYLYTVESQKINDHIWFELGIKEVFYFANDPDILSDAYFDQIHSQLDYIWEEISLR